jgi:hypothetical protein
MLEELYAKAEQLAGRPVEVDQTKDGKFIVLWMSFGRSPPPKADTEVLALEGFIEMMERVKPGSEVPEEDTEEITKTSLTQQG